jgi:hypothetical protein
MSDATVVVESGLKGGALITADMANSYMQAINTTPDLFIFYPGQQYIDSSKMRNTGRILKHSGIYYQSALRDQDSN